MAQSALQIVVLAPFKIDLLVAVLQGFQTIASIELKN